MASVGLYMFLRGVSFEQIVFVMLLEPDGAGANGRESSGFIDSSQLNCTTIQHYLGFLYDPLLLDFARGGGLRTEFLRYL